MIQELKAFLLRGDVLAMAVGVVIALAFSAVIDSLVADIISPILGMIIGETDFSYLKIGSIQIGSFINAVVKFLIIGTALFFVIKAAGKKAEDVK